MPADESPIAAATFGPDALWCLGIDVGTTALSAVLLHYQTGQTYPLVWQETETSEQPLASLPAIAYLSASQLQQAPEAPDALGYQALELALSTPSQAEMPSGLLLSNIKPYLNAATPYVNEPTQTWEPVLQWSDQQTLALRWYHQALVALLETLQGKTAGLRVIAPTLTVETFQAALANLSSVVVGCLTGWSDTYCFNVREAVLTAGLVERAEQIYFIEDAIAALLATLPQPITPERQFNDFPLSNKAEVSLQGGTLVVSAGATTTELLLVDVPADVTLLNREALYLRSLAYAGDALDQDIICQILYPSASHWDELALQSLDLPLPGEPDQEARDRLQQRLRSSELGTHLLNAARQLKLALQQQDSATFTLNNQQWTVSQQELHNQVVTPYLQQLNRELNVLLNQSGIVVQAVRQVICTGGTTALPAITHWLKQKLPNTRLIQALEPDGRDGHLIARGLATLPHYPQVLDDVRHQYSDYFLLHELMRILPDEPLFVGRILQLLENQGINTSFCQRPILSLLEGQLPIGLVPSNDNSSLLTASSRQNPDYQFLLSTPLFLRGGNQLYGFNPEGRDRLQRYLAALLTDTHQKLTEPLPIEFGAAVRAGG
ncbi:hypothetical protein H6F76_24485 [Leptolyngbya sp. FACHB-321]|uniref:hypothetical protein n=1 Tax=Leptolyngbya sp. FACHB-321 TaxID=2692807 RepID=UPI001686038B|nr:hypothetical protein [Leptolyngbya sp. FACHB-321]MBD2038114.1 hypothetical protein [Leptolyngbya sp. FACHB-321]